MTAPPLSPQLSTSSGPVAVVAGAGRLPALVAEAALAAGRKVTVIGLSGAAGDNIAHLPHEIVKWGEIGRFMKILNREGIVDLVLAGAVVRPTFADFKPDFGALAYLPRLVRILRGGDDSVLGKAARELEAMGVTLRGAQEIAPGLIAPVGVLTRAGPDDEEADDIAVGFTAARAVGALDIGQAVIVDGGRVVAVEGVEGTNGLLARLPALREAGRWRTKARRAGVLVKVAKPEQDLRFDLPVIGRETVELAAEAGLAGIALEAGRVMIIDRADTADAGDRKGVFVTVLVPPGQTRPDLPPDHEKTNN